MKNTILTTLVLLMGFSFMKFAYAGDYNFNKKVVVPDVSSSQFVMAKNAEDACCDAAANVVAVCQITHYPAVCMQEIKSAAKVCDIDVSGIYLQDYQGFVNMDNTCSFDDSSIIEQASLSNMVRNMPQD
ncbi:hypothetical protein K1X76_04495 [bacterium]|nr:hypothetical protein [bacterium]